MSFILFLTINILVIIGLALLSSQQYDEHNDKETKHAMKEAIFYIESRARGNSVSPRDDVSHGEKELNKKARCPACRQWGTPESECVHCGHPIS